MRYSHGGDIYTYGDLLDFSVNINPLGISGSMIAEAAKRGISRRQRPILTASAENCGKTVPAPGNAGKRIMYLATVLRKFSYTLVLAGKAGEGSSSCAGFFRI